jgi:hypothetical protein
MLRCCFLLSDTASGSLITPSSPFRKRVVAHMGDEMGWDRLAAHFVAEMLPGRLTGQVKVASLQAAPSTG